MRDSIWQFWGVVASMIAIAVSLVVAWQQSRRKRLAYDVRRESLFSISAAVGSKLRIYYEDELVSTAALYQIRIANDGNMPIDAKDFAEPLTISFGDTAKILSAQVTTKEPPQLTVQLRIDAERAAIVIAPTLLNQRDVFVINTVVGGGGDVNLGARISGVHAIELRRPLSQWMLRTRGMTGLGLVVVGGLFCAAIATWIENAFTLPGPWGLVAVCLIIAIGTVVANPRLSKSDVV